jgi:hypothetical protein
MGRRSAFSTISVSPLTAKITKGSSRLPAGFRSRLSRGWWLSPSGSSRFCRFGRDRFSRFAHGWLSRFGCGRFSGFAHGWLSPIGCGRLSHFGRSWLPRFGHGGLFRFDYDFNWSRQFRLGLLPSAMVARVQQLDAVGFFVRPQLSVFTASAFVLEVFRNRFRCHGRSVAEPSSSKLSNCDHSMTI